MTHGYTHDINAGGFTSGYSFKAVVTQAADGSLELKPTDGHGNRAVAYKLEAWTRNGKQIGDQTLWRSAYGQEALVNASK